MYHRVVRVLFCLFPLIVFAPPSAVADNGVYEDWIDLWTRCRVAIETGQPLNAEGLFLIEPPASSQYDSRNDSHRAWRREGNRFVLVEREWHLNWHQGDGVRRGCEVILAPDTARLGELDEAILIRGFLVERATLMVNRTHEVRDPDPIFPIVGLGVGPISENANGCRVISFIYFGTADDFFWSGSGEQNRPGCAGLSLFNDAATAEP